MTAPELTDITVALIDDHDVVHEGLASWCAGATPPIAVAGRYLRPTEFLRDRAGGQGMRIDAVVLDLQFGDGSPLPALDMVGTLTDAGYRVIVYSMRSDAATILDCLDNGAVTYLTKSEGRQHLVPAIEAAVTDHPYMSPSMAGAMSADTRASRPKLTEREREVLIQWFRTESKNFAAKALYITASTLATHLGRVRTKYAAAGRPAGVDESGTRRQGAAGRDHQHRRPLRGTVSCDFAGDHVPAMESSSKQMTAHPMPPAVPSIRN